MNHDLTKGSVGKTLIRFSLPYLFSSFLQTFYGLVDLYVTGQFNGAGDISAVAIGSQVMHMLTVIIVGLAMGSTVNISLAAGRKQWKKAAGIIGNTALLFLGASLVLTVLLMVAVDGIVGIMSTPPEAAAQARAYLLICFGGIPFITAYNVISCAFRGMGDSKSPMYFVGAACVLNIGLDYLFIGGLDMGAAGAAWGTVISQSVSVLIALVMLKRQKLGIQLRKEDFRLQRQSMKSILTVGIPVACQDGFIQVSFLIITMIANQRGVVIAASVGIVEKIIGFLFLVPSAMLSSISAIAAQNVGAGIHERAKKTLGYGIAIAAGFGICVGIVCQFASGPFVGLFSDDSEVVRMGAQYLRSYVWDCAAAGVHFCFSGFFCAYGKSGFSFLHNTISIICVRIPGAYLASRLFPDSLYPMGWAPPAGSILSSLICVGLYLAYRKRFFGAERG